MEEKEMDKNEMSDLKKEVKSVLGEWSPETFKGIHLTSKEWLGILVLGIIIEHELLDFLSDGSREVLFKGLTDTDGRENNVEMAISLLKNWEKLKEQIERAMPSPSKMKSATEILDKAVSKVSSIN